MSAENSPRKDDVEAKYSAPEQLVADGSLSKDEKISRLRDWEHLVRRRLDSAAEGMLPAGQTNEASRAADDPIARDADLLRKIDLQLEKLNSDG